MEPTVPELTAEDRLLNDDELIAVTQSRNYLVAAQQGAKKQREITKEYYELHEKQAIQASNKALVERIEQGVFPDKYAYCLNSNYPLCENCPSEYQEECNYFAFFNLKQEVLGE